jgi:hypothetical protein
MKIIRYLDVAGQEKFGALQADGSAKEISGDIYGKFAVTEQKASVQKLRPLRR